MSSFIKWVGSKRQLLPILLNYVPEHFNNYFEPFLGSGALFFKLYSLGRLENKKIYLFDKNKELINTYKVIKNYPNELIIQLKEFQNKHNKEFYYKIRSLDRDDNYNNLSCITKAARFIYLNKTCFNGLYRVNKKGYFNVPIGSYDKPKIFDEKNILKISNILKNTIIKHCDYKEILNYVNKNDFIYLDPPYYPISKTSNFTSYIQTSFLEREHIELYNTFKLLSKNNFVLESNSDVEFINNLYNEFKIEKIYAYRTINSNPHKRGKIKEIIIKNY